MSSVIADGEEVVFDGDVPTDPNHVYELLMGALSENGRAVVKFIVDGVDTVASGDTPSTYDKIEVISLSHDELTLRLIIESMNHLSTAEKEFEAYIRNILSVAWSSKLYTVSKPCSPPKYGSGTSKSLFGYNSFSIKCTFFLSSAESAREITFA